MSQFDKEYYIMKTDGASNHPLLAWGKTSGKPFIFPKPIEENAFEALPLKINFSKPYPSKPQIADILFLSGDLAVSEKVKIIFERMNIYGVQFFPVVIETNKEQIIEGHYVLHPWLRIAAVDKHNYIGSEITDKGRIDRLEKFSLDEKILSEIPLEKRLVFHLAESKTERLIHKSVYEALVKENLTGFAFFRVDDWDMHATFR